MRPNNKGFISIISLLLMLIGLLVTFAITDLAIGQLVSADKMANNAIALSLAEAGVEYTLAQLRQSSTYPGTNADINLDQGTFHTTVTSTGTDSYKIVSTGKLPDGTTKIVEVNITTTGTPSLASGAIVSNGGAVLNGNVTIQTYPTNQHYAHVYANGNINAYGNVSIDGGLYAGGMVNLYGNSYYREKKDGASQIQFPTAADINAKDADWKSRSQQGTTYMNEGISLSGNQSITYNTPLYINGNVKLSGNSELSFVTPLYVKGDVTLSGNSQVTFNGSGVVYIDGNIELTGNQAIYNGAILVVKGKITQTGNSLYKSTGDMGTCGMVSLSTDPTAAIKCTGNGWNNPMGLIYAPLGGITFVGNSDIRAALVAGSTNANAVTMTGNSSVSYPIALQNNILLPKTLSVAAWLQRM